MAFSLFDTRKRTFTKVEQECFYHEFVLELMVEFEDAVRVALTQIEEKRYAAVLMGKGIPAERIRKYGFVFEGKTVLIG